MEGGSGKGNEMGFQWFFQALWTWPGADVWPGAPAPGQQRLSPWPTSCSVSALGSVLEYLLALSMPTMPLSRQDQYQLCYRAALEYLGSFDHYAT